MYACSFSFRYLAGRSERTALNFDPMKTIGVLVLKLGATKSDSAVVSLSRSQLGRPQKLMHIFDTATAIPYY
jgi:hypothetical protein